MLINITDLGKDVLKSGEFEGKKLLSSESLILEFAYKYPDVSKDNILEYLNYFISGYSSFDEALEGFRKGDFFLLPDSEGVILNIKIST